MALTDADIRAIVLDVLNGIRAGAGTGLVGGGTTAFDHSFAADFGLAAGKVLEGVRWNELVKLAGDRMQGPLLVQDPTSPDQAANRRFVEAAVDGQTNRTEAKTIALAPITLSGLQNLNGHTGAENDLVVVAGQTTLSENDLYQMKSTAWVRATPDLWERKRGLTVFLTSGNYKDTAWMLATTVPMDVGVSAVRWRQVSAPSELTPEAPVVRVGNLLRLLIKSAGGIGYDADGIFVQAITDAIHGVLSGGNLHALSSGTVAGFQSSAHHLKLEAIEAQATRNLPADAAPPDLHPTASQAGVSALYARKDHSHRRPTIGELGGVPEQRTVQGQNGVLVNGSELAQALTQNLTFSLQAATLTKMGGLSPADKLKIDQFRATEVANAITKWGMLPFEVVPLGTAQPVPIADPAFFLRSDGTPVSATPRYEGVSNQRRARRLICTITVNTFSEYVALPVDLVRIPRLNGVTLSTGGTIHTTPIADTIPGAYVGTLEIPLDVEYAIPDNSTLSLRVTPFGAGILEMTATMELLPILGATV